jgi:beta-N-acetylhexosaminidase
MIQGYLDGGVLPVIKHLPGHGRALVDSHLELPRVEEDVDLLRAADWPPFTACKDAPFAMTAHILFGSLDAGAPATQSARVIQEVIRSEIGFKGAILSDDLSMQALGGSLGERTARARQAGCDLALHCNGDLLEMSDVLAAAGPLEGKALDRVERALALREPASPVDPVEGRARLDRLVLAYDGASEMTA